MDMSAEQANADLMVNNLIYKEPQALSLATDKTEKKMFFQRNEYTGDRSTTMICDWNTGSNFVDVYNSYLSFKVTLTGTTPTANWGSGSAMNIFNELRIQSRSGVECSRDQNVNLWSKYDAFYSKPSTWFETMGAPQGYGPTQSGAGDAANLSATAARFCIPLCELSTFFRPTKGQHIPPQIASGMHMEFVLEDFRTALFQKSGTVTGYEISNLFFNLSCVSMSDDTQRSINSESANVGLDYSYERMFASISQVPIGQTTISLQVRKAVSIANYAYAIALDAADRIDVTKDSLVSIAFNYNSWQYRIGSQWYPHQQVNDANDGLETYMLAQSTWDKMKHQYSQGNVSLTRFKASTGIIAHTFESNSSLSISGTAINNSRTLELNAEFASVPATLEVITFLNYSAVAKAFIDNLSVSI